MRAFIAALAMFVASTAFAAAPKRIVTLAPSCAEIIAGLGLGDTIVGVTSYTDWPPRVRKLPQVGSYVKINVEAVLALRPDLVVATDDGNPPAALRQLERAGVPVVTLGLRDFAAIQQSILSLGARTGRVAAARKMVAEMRRVATCVAERTRAVKRPKVLFAYELAPIVSAGQGTFTDELLAMAGADSITKDVAQPYPRMTTESVVARAPDVIVVPSLNLQSDSIRWKAWLAEWPRLPAARNGRLHLIDSTNVDRPSQRVILGLTLLARTIHPSLFAHGECAAALP